MKQTIGLILAGGEGSRLSVLAQARAKPAVPFGGIYRIIDFTLSNAANSGVHRLGVLTQYKPLSLMEHLGAGDAWGFFGRTRRIKILPPRTGKKDSDWYRGTADAVRQNMDFLESYPEYDTLLILSGDHIYHMNYSEMVQFHRERHADLTIATMRVPIEEARHFGIAQVDHDYRIIDWEEKPEKPKSNLASMGIYVFSLAFLRRAFQENPGPDFGKHIVPFACEHADIYAFPFNGYWRDVGTLKSYWQTNLDLLSPETGIDPGGWKIYPNLDEKHRIGDRPPTFMGSNATVRNSLISHGCIIEGTVINSVLSPGVYVQRDTVIQESIIMSGCEIGEGAWLERVILDKQVIVGDGARIGEGEPVPNEEKPQLLEAGLTVIGKHVTIPNKAHIGKHCVIFPHVKAEEFPASIIPSGTTLKKLEMLEEVE
ncbi:MAG: sugar phosphate nucleotidyltransferase [candidate division KSB1 bacterium]|nr:sugar phosphate nucleotidyltransferase [candidate division KSB1 bacterium]